MSFRLASLASGSTGNAVYAEYDGCRILIDDGITWKALCETLAQLGTSPQELDALLLTHEHSDHISGLPVLMRRLAVPVYVTEGTFAAMARLKMFERLPKAGFHLIRAGDRFEIGTVCFQALPTKHDCRESVAYRGDGVDGSFAVITDLGEWDEETVRQLSGLRALFLEANHNVRMLETGPYPYPLKMRIRSCEGHLSNEDAAALLARIWHPALKDVILGHISQINNYPLLALETVRQKLEASGIAPGALRLSAAPPAGLSAVIRWQDD